MSEDDFISRRQARFDEAMAELAAERPLHARKKRCQ